jgi:dihydrofolate reductase
VAGDKFKLGSRLDTGSLLLGRGTRHQFAKMWPSRSDEFSTEMNSAPKRVATPTLSDLSAWNNSELISADLPEEVRRLRRERDDVIVIDSTNIVKALRQHELVDEYRLLVFPTVLGTGRHLFDGPAGAVDLRPVSVEQGGATVLLRYERAGK